MPSRRVVVEALPDLFIGEGLFRRTPAEFLPANASKYALTMKEAAKAEPLKRIEMDGPSIEALIRSAGLELLRSDSTELERNTALNRGATSLDALCGLSDAEGTGAVWDVLCELDRGQLLSFATFAISETAEHTQYHWSTRPEN